MPKITELYFDGQLRSGLATKSTTGMEAPSFRRVVSRGRTTIRSLKKLRSP